MGRGAAVGSVWRSPAPHPCWYRFLNVLCCVTESGLQTTLPRKPCIRGEEITFFSQAKLEREQYGRREKKRPFAVLCIQIGRERETGKPFAVLRDWATARRLSMLCWGLEQPRQPRVNKQLTWKTSASVSLGLTREPFGCDLLPLETEPLGTDYPAAL